MHRLTLAFLLACACVVPVSAQTIPATTKNASGTIGTGTTFQSVLAAGNRRALTIQNNNTNGDNCWVFLGPHGSATTGTSILLQPGGSYVRYYPYVPSDNIDMTCTTTSDTFYLGYQ